MSRKPEMSATFRKGTLDDASAITSIQLDAWKVAYANFIPRALLDALSFEKRLQTWKKIIEGDLGIILVATLDTKLIGFLHIVMDSKDQFELVRLYMHPEIWGSGIAGTLLHEGIRRLPPSAERLSLWVAERNDRARKFYEMFGFVLVSGKSRLDSFSEDGRPPLDVRKKEDPADATKGEFNEVSYELNLKG